jgi:DNA-binding response OmpR family regulator
VSAPRVAVVDDDVATCLLLCELLADEGYVPVAWETDENPATFVLHNAPDLVILDLRLRDDAAAETVIAALCGLHAAVQTPVIACSADRALLQRDAEALRARGCVVVEKPFELQDLLDMVSMLLQSRPVAGTLPRHG